MEVQCITSDRKDEWNDFVKQETSFVLFQSWEWGDFKKKMGWSVYRIVAQEQGRIVAGVQLLIRHLPLALLSIGYIPRGPIGDWLKKDIATLLFDEVHRIAKRHRSIFLKIEPAIANTPTSDEFLRELGFQASEYTNQPRATIIVDLEQEEEDLVKQLRDSTRRKIKAALRNGVTVRVGDRADIPAVHRLLQRTGKRENFSTRSRAYYEEEWEAFAQSNQVALLLAYSEEQLIAAHIAFSIGSHAAYFHGASLEKYTLLRPNDLLVWEAIRWAKAKGCQTYDLWGIPDEVGHMVFEGIDPPAPDRTDGLWGVYQFKRGFSKNVVTYIGSYDFIYMPVFYSLFVRRMFSPHAMGRFSALLDRLRLGHRN